MSQVDLSSCSIEVPGRKLVLVATGARTRSRSNSQSCGDTESVIEVHAIIRHFMATLSVTFLPMPG
jgi:hypothetical protein